jgi:cell division protein FtsL
MTIIPFIVLALAVIYAMWKLRNANNHIADLEEEVYKLQHRK